MKSITILWADDEIDLLKPQILFLQEKGYHVIPVTNGQDAAEVCRKEAVDVVFLDESMPGLSGLETLALIKESNRHIPVVMITKNEEENLMEEAIGSQISDYLIKPVKPQQILSSLKKIIEHERLVGEKTSSAYQQEFQKLFLRMQDKMDHKEWSELYKKLIYWELELDKAEAKEMKEVFQAQKSEANNEFNKFVIKNYKSWIKADPAQQAPIMSHNLLRNKLLPLLQDNKPTFLVLIDNLRFDQWKVIEGMMSSSFRVLEEDGC